MMNKPPPQQLDLIPESETDNVESDGSESLSDLIEQAITIHDHPQSSASTATTLTLNNNPPSYTKDTISPSHSSYFFPSNDFANRRIQRLKQDIQTASAATPQRSNDNLFKQVCSTDLLFLIDTTSSMIGHINAAKDQIKSIVKDISAAFFNEAEVRIAVVGYKDHKNTNSIQALEFTTNVNEVHSFLASLNALGGADLPEDVLGGLRRALNASWKHKTRCIIHIADAPPHGQPLHDLAASSDDWPIAGTEPHGLTHQPLLEQMIKLNINYALLRINSFTDKMAYVFAQEYTRISSGVKLLKRNKYHSMLHDEMALKLRNGYYSRIALKRNPNAGLLFEEQELGTTYSALRHLVLKNVTTSVSRTAVRELSASSRTSSKMGKMRQAANLMAINEEEDLDDRLETSPPQWDKKGWLNETLLVEGFCPDVSVHDASTLIDMMSSDDNIKMQIMELTIHRRSRPFSQGALRMASYARTDASEMNFVVKTYKRNGKRFVDMAEDMRVQALCKAFALEFNAMVEDKHALDFIVTTCLKGTSRTNDSNCMSLEPYLSGSYTKYNNNSGFISDTASAFNTSAQAFSHFTFERSNGRLLVCDLQGVAGLLTDPAIHTADPTRFKLTDTNLGREGFKFFFATHVCNSICRDLKLQSSAEMLMKNESTFRETWPDLSETVCCANRLCGRIVRKSDAMVEKEFDGMYWCGSCWPWLAKSRVSKTCEGPGDEHTFEVSRFFCESQGQRVPATCLAHREFEVVEARDDGDWLSLGVVGAGSGSASIRVRDADKGSVHRGGLIGCGLWTRLRHARRKLKIGGGKGKGKDKGKDRAGNGTEMQEKGAGYPEQEGLDRYRDL